MQREASLLRCSKLSCYAEFNRMVQAIARSGSEGGGWSGGLSTVPGANSMRGTSAEYLFYTTLSMMLRQVISNSSNPTTQREELQRIYQWFCINKPLIAAKTNPKAQKPALMMSSLGRGTAGFSPASLTDLERPQTAPAALYQLQSDAPRGSQRPSTSPMNQTSGRPAAYTQSFASSYMTRSLSADLDLVGRPFDQLVDIRPQDTLMGMVDSSSQSKAGQPQRKLQAPAKAGGAGRSKRQGKAPASPPSTAIVNFPTGNSLSGYPERPSTVSFGNLFTLAPGVAARMALDREMQIERDEQVRCALTRPATRVRTHPGMFAMSHTLHRELVTTPVSVEEQKSQTELGELGTEGVGAQQHQGLSEETRKRSAEREEGEDPQLMDRSVQTGQTQEEKLEMAVSIQEGRIHKDSASEDAASQSGTGQKDLTFMTTTELHGTEGPPAMKVESTPAGERESGGEISKTVTFQGISNQTADPKAKPAGVPAGEGGVERVTHSEKGGSKEDGVGEGGQTGQIRVTVSSVQRPQTVGSGVRVGHHTPQRRLSTPLNVVAISFPSIEEKRPHTSHGALGVRGKPKQTQRIGAGFNRHRYRVLPKSSATVQTPYCS